MARLHYSQGTGISHEIVVSLDYFIIRTNYAYDANTLLEESGVDITRVKHVDNYPEANVDVYQVLGNFKFQQRDKIKKIVKTSQHPALDYIGSVMQHAATGIYQIYTGNIYLQFQAETPKIVIGKVQEEFNLEQKDLLISTPHAYYMRFINEKEVGREIFNKCNEILKREEVISCYPELIVKRKGLKRKKPDDVIAILDADWSSRMIRLEEAWKLSKGKGVKICIIDDGIDYDHPAFANDKIVAAYDTLQKSKEATHKAINELHGTACASIAASQDKHAVGIAPEAQLLVVRCKGLGSVHEALAIEWAVQNGADIISCSWGPADGNPATTVDDKRPHPLPDHTRLAMDYALKEGRNKKGCLILFAAGNGNEPVRYDGYASYEKVLAIGAVNKYKHRSLYSDYGAPLFACFPSSEVIIDPESNDIYTVYGVRTADRLGLEGYSEDDYYNSFGGTSAAAPGVAGVAALMLSLNPELSSTELKSLLRQSARLPNGNTTSVSTRNYGYGIIDAAIAVELTMKNLKQNLIKFTNTNMKKTRNYALHVGINEFSRDAFPYPISPLAGCVNDAKYYATLTKDFTEKPMLLTNSKATRLAFGNWVKDTASKAIAGDTVIISLSTHGSTIQDFNNDEVNDDQDETLVLYDGFLIDDEIAELYSNFAAGVDIIQISDTCHSGTITKNINAIKAKSYNHTVRWVDSPVIYQAFKKNEEKYRQEWSRLGEGNLVQKLKTVRANVINISGCKDDQLSQEFEGKGLMSRCFEEIFVSNKGFTLREFHDKLKVRMADFTSPIAQESQLFTYGRNPEKVQNRTFSDIMGYDRMSTLSKPCNSSSSSQPADNHMNENLNATSAIVYGNLLVIGGSSTSVNDGQQQQLVVDGKVMLTSEGTRSMENKVWDNAYRVMLSSEDLDYVEPDITSMVNADPTLISKRSSDTDYLETYPHPGDEDVNRLIWHLDDKHSQLRSAAYSACPELNIDLPRKASKYPLIAHIDTGILDGHPSMPVNYDSEKSRAFANDIDRDKWIGIEQQGHGQGTLSILAGKTWSDMQLQAGESRPKYFGAFPYARVMTLRIADKVAIINAKKFAKAVDHAIKEGAEVISMSMAGAPSKVMIEAINRAYEAGVIVVSAGGNKWVKTIKKWLPDTLMYPARLGRVIAAVGATYKDEPYQREFDEPIFRNSGDPDMESCYGPDKDMGTALAAYTPNVTWIGSNKGKMYNRTGGGTSSATPQIAAAAALYLHKHRDFFNTITKKKHQWKKVEIVRKALFCSANKATGYDKYFGQGILRAMDALEINPADLLDEIIKTKPDNLGRSGLDELVKMWFPKFRGNQNITNKQDKISEMLALEIAQLTYQDKSLAKYAEKDGISVDMARNILQSNKASQFLKEIVRLKLDNIGNSSVPEKSTMRQVWSDVVHDETFRVLTNLPFRELKINDHSKLETSEQIIAQIEIDISATASRDSAERDVVVGLPLKEDFAVMYQLELEDGRKIAFWDVDLLSENSNLRSVSRKVNLRTGERLSSMAVMAATSGRTRGFKFKKLFKNAKKVIVSIVNTLLDRPVKGYEGLQVADFSGDKVKLTKLADYGGKLKGKKTLLFLHGTWASSDGTFEDLWQNKSFRETVHQKFGNRVLTYEMSTIRSGVKKNACNLLIELDSLNIDRSKLFVVGSSRGCLVARYAFENNVPMVLSAGTNFGTPLAGKNNIPKLLNRASTLLSLIGPLSPLTNSIFSVVGLLIKSVLSAPGIADQALDSDIIKEINEKGLTKKQLLLASNFEPEPLIKTILDEVVDSQLFSGVNNDGIAPTIGALGLKNGDRYDRPEGEIFLIPDRNVHHFSYFKNEKSVEKIINHMNTN